MGLKVQGISMEAMRRMKLLRLGHGSSSKAILLGACLRKVLATPSLNFLSSIITQTAVATCVKHEAVYMVPSRY